MRCSVLSLALAGLVVGLSSCRAFERTIPEREGRLRVKASEIPLSLSDEHPELLRGAEDPGAPRLHLDSVPTLPESVRLPARDPVSMELRGLALGEAISAMAASAGVSVLGTEDLRTPVDVSLTEQPLDQAFAWLLERHDLRLERRPGGALEVVSRDRDVRVDATFRLRSVALDQVEAAIAALAGAEARVVSDPRAKVIVVSGPRSGVLAVGQYLDQVDHRTPQILVEARILEVTLGENFGLGITGLVDGTIEGGPASLLHNLAISEDDAFALTLGTRDGTVEGTIQAISQYVGTEVISSPRVLALSGTEATIEVVREVPYVQVTSTTTGTTAGIGSQTLEEVEFKEAGVRLRVTPVLEEGGYVRMRVDQEFSEVTERFQDIPIIDKRTIGADFLVRDRDTVVLGGLMQDRRSETDRGVPGLARIPLLGRLFRSDEDERQKRELIVFLTPRVVDDPETRRLVEAMREAYANTLRNTGVRSVREAQVSPW